jgi:hypothetical protein
VRWALQAIVDTCRYLAIYYPLRFGWLHPAHLEGQMVLTSVQDVLADPIHCINL